MPATKTLISVDNISLKKHGKKVLHKVSFDLKQGEFITLIGPNGAGKSSLIKVILGLIKADSGTVNRANVVIGYTPQTFTPNPFIPITAADFLHLNLKDDDSFFAKICALTNVTEILKTQLQNLSGGEIQRVLLTRALLKKPQVLILDEPAQNLDINGQMQLYQLIKTIHKQQNTATLMVSHDLHRVMRESTQVLCLYHHICCIGQPESILKDAQFNDLFKEQMDELTTTYNHHHNHTHNH